MIGYGVSFAVGLCEYPPVLRQLHLGGERIVMVGSVDNKLLAVVANRLSGPLEKFISGMPEGNGMREVHALETLLGAGYVYARQDWAAELPRESMRVVELRARIGPMLQVGPPDPQTVEEKWREYKCN